MSRRKNLPGVPHRIDVHVGERLRIRRKLLGLTQTHLAQAVGVTFQQVQKYERGTTRVSASRLYEFSQILNVRTGYFFDDMPDEVALDGVLGSVAPTSERERMNDHHTVELVESYYRIANPSLRDKLRMLIQMLAAEGGFESS